MIKQRIAKHLVVFFFITINTIFAPLKAQQMMYEDTSRIGVPYAKDPHVVRFKGRYLMYYSIPPRQWNGMEEYRFQSPVMATGYRQKHFIS